MGDDDYAAVPAEQCIHQGIKTLVRSKSVSVSNSGSQPRISAHLNIEVVSRLIKQEDVRLLQRQQCECHARLLTPGKRADEL